MDVITSQSKKLEALTNKDDHKDNYKKKYLMNQSKNQINKNDLIYHFKCNSTRNRFDDFNNGIKLFEK